MCSTLAESPTLLSPIKFHNSVHNAAAGYWTIGTGCMAASNSLSAFESSFASGLLEAAAQCAADQQAVLLAGYDMPSVGALSSVTTSRELLAVALVVAPTRTERTVASFDWSLASGTTAPQAPRSGAARALQVNAMSDALPLFEALARGEAGTIDLPSVGRALPSTADRAAPERHGRSPAPSRRRDHGRRTRGPDAGAALKRRFADSISWCSNAAPPCTHATHKVGESSVEIGANYFDTVLGLKST